MVQLKILSGKQAGHVTVARRFPFRVGRAGDTDLALEEPGVWERHLEIEFEPRDGFYAVPQGQALITVNGAPTQHTRLRNGDCIELGGTTLQFWLGETRQRGLRFHTWLVWVTIAVVTGSQLYLIVRLF